MTSTVEIAASPLIGVLIVSAMGVCLLAPLDARTRNLLLPAAPVVGLAYLVASLHTAAAFVPVGTGIYCVVALAIALFAFAWRRGRRPWHYSRKAAVWTLVGLSVGLVGAWLALTPSLMLDDSAVISPTSSHDSFYYVAGAEWLQAHAIVDSPEIGPSPGTGNALPVYGPAASSTDLNLRWGVELTGAGLASLTGTDPVDTFTPWQATWPLVIPGACIAGATLLGRRRMAGAVAGLMISSSAILLHQVFNQNAASLLGISLVLLFIPLGVACIERRVSLWLGALVLGAIVGSYTEFAPVVAPAMVGAMLFAQPRLAPTTGRTAKPERGIHLLLDTRWGRTLTLTALSVLLAPVAWLRALRQILGNAQSGYDSVPSAFQLPDKSTVIARMLGVESLTSLASMQWMALALFALLALGAVFAVTLKGARGAWIGALGGGSLLVAYLTLADRGYTQRRAIDVFLPIVILAAVLGWDAFVSRVSKLSRRAGTAAAMILALPVVLWTVENGETVRDEAHLTPPSRVVDGDFAQAAGWLTELSSNNGSNAAVVVPSFFDQLWISESLRDLPDVAYPSINPSYLRLSAYWDQNPDRYVLVGHGALVKAAPGTVIRRNNRFRLLDTHAGQVVVAAPAESGLWEPFPDVNGHLVTHAQANTLLVLGTQGSSRLDLTISSAKPELSVDLSVQGLSPIHVEGPGPQRVALTTASRTPSWQIIHIVNRRWDDRDPPGTALTVSAIGRS